MIRCVLYFLLLFIHSLASTDNRFRRQANGCGPVNLNIDTFLRQIGEEFLITCCNDHDLCYDTCGKTQITCDIAFLHCMIQECQQLLSPSDVNRCQNDSYILFWFVFFGGRSSYQQAQEQHECTLSNVTTNNTFLEAVGQQ